MTHVPSESVINAHGNPLMRDPDDDGHRNAPTHKPPEQRQQDADDAHASSKSASSLSLESVRSRMLVTSTFNERQGMSDVTNASSGRSVVDVAQRARAKQGRSDISAVEALIAKLRVHKALAPITTLHRTSGEIGRHSQDVAESERAEGAHCNART